LRAFAGGKIRQEAVVEQQAVMTMVAAIAVLVALGPKVPGGGKAVCWSAHYQGQPGRVDGIGFATVGGDSSSGCW
jgi:hypothetical protein